MKRPGPAEAARIASWAPNSGSPKPRSSTYGSRLATTRSMASLRLDGSRENGIASFRIHSSRAV